MSFDYIFLYNIVPEYLFLRTFFSGSFQFYLYSLKQTFLIKFIKLV